MPAYVSRTIGQFIDDDVSAIVGSLQQAYASDGFASQYTRQTKAWAQVVPKLQRIFIRLLHVRPEAQDWTILLEYPLYRLRRRIDIVILTQSMLVVVECKVGADAFTAEDRRQAEEYALDLRDFHAKSYQRRIFPVLWSTDAEPTGGIASPTIAPPPTLVDVVRLVGDEGLHQYLSAMPISDGETSIVGEEWDRSAYRPVPNVIEAATSIFAGHDVRSIANADADNLQSAAARLVALIKQAREEGRRFLLILTGVPGIEAATSIFAGHDVRSIANADADNLQSAAARLVALIKQAREEGRRFLLILTGVPGSGKTLAGLHVVHSTIATDAERHGDIVYLSGNTPLVVVLREALARDEHSRRRRAGERKSLGIIRREVRARIQHINDFLQESFRGTAEDPPHEHVIVFDEAQRAWDEKQGMEKFERTASEPALLLELMSRHHDWCACICLIGGGQEINSGEEGVFGWGEALRKMGGDDQREWSVFAPPDVLHGGPSAGSFTLGELPPALAVSVEPDLQLRVPQRSYGSPNLSRWVDYVLSGNEGAAQTVAESLHEYPLVVTRSLAKAKAWLQERGRGERRYGLVASSGARRLRAEGLGVTLNATAGDEIAQWYLNPQGDIRSSYALEVPANEYTCQGLELDFACICWGGDLLWSDVSRSWTFSRLSGTSWQRVRNHSAQRFMENSYRVLLTRAREGSVLWIPVGDDSDSTRAFGPLDSTATFLIRCGAVPIAAD